MNIKLTLGERLKDLRVERHLKLETLAEQTGSVQIGIVEIRERRCDRPQHLCSDNAG